jgi:PleD family two-component response regulator
MEKEPLTIVLAGYSEPIFRTLVRTLTDEDRLFYRSASPHAALAYVLSNQNVATVISTYSGSPMNGLSLIRQLKLKGNTRTVVIIISESPIDTTIRDQITHEGGYFMNYPFDNDQLCDRVRLILGAFIFPINQLQA